MSSRTFERAAGLALETEQRGRLLFAAADAAWLGGLSDRAVELLDEAGKQAGEPALHLQVEQLRGHIAIRRGYIGDGRRILLDAVEGAAGVDPQRAVVMLAEAVDSCFYAGDAEAMMQIAKQIPALAAACGDTRTEFFATMSEGMALVFSGGSARALS